MITTSELASNLGQHPEQVLGWKRGLENVMQARDEWLWHVGETVVGAIAESSIGDDRFNVNTVHLIY